MIRGARAAKGGPSWQDLRVVYPPTAICGAFRMHGAHILPEPARFRMHGARILPRTGGFPARGRFRDAWGEKIATDCRPGTHRARILPLPVRPRAHQGAIPPPSDAGGTHLASVLPSSSAWERTVVKYCHYQSPENAFRAYPAIAGCLGMHSVDILPSADIRECTASAYRHCQSPVTQRSPRGGVSSVPWLRCGVRRATLSVRGSGHSVFSGLNCWERFRVCAVSVGNHELASRSAKLCRIMC